MDDDRMRSYGSVQPFGQDRDDGTADMSPTTKRQARGVSLVAIALFVGYVSVRSNYSPNPLARPLGKIRFYPDLLIHLLIILHSHDDFIAGSPSSGSLAFGAAHQTNDQLNGSNHNVMELAE